MDSLVTVSRTISNGSGVTVSETVSATLADDLVLDDDTEGSRRHVLAHFLFLSLPQLQPTKSPPSCPPPTSLHSNN